MLARQISMGGLKPEEPTLPSKGCCSHCHVLAWQTSMVEMSQHTMHSTMVVTPKSPARVLLLMLHRRMGCLLWWYIPAHRGNYEDLRLGVQHRHQNSQLLCGDQAACHARACQHGHASTVEAECNLYFKACNRALMFQDWELTTGGCMLWRWPATGYGLSLHIAVGV